MEALDTAKSIAKPFEGWSEIVYLCPAGYPTIAWGHRCSKDHPPVDKIQGEIYLSADMIKALKGALKYCPVLLQDVKKLGAITDFCFNLGVGRLQTSTLKRRINQEDWPEVKNELLKWVFGGGKKLPGLVKRRLVEASFIQKPII
jgi:lysozyme